MKADDMFAAITAQRLRLVETLSRLDKEQWDMESLCDGWRVRDVVGHLVSVLEIPMGRFVLNVVKARSFDRYAHAVAREVGARDPGALCDSYRALASKRFAPPVVGAIGPLSDVLIHTRDIERPLGILSTLEPAAVTAALEYLCGGKAWGFVPPRRTKGLRFAASDLSWSVGIGPDVVGTGEAIMMAVSGRRVAVADLAGPGAATLADRLR